MQPLITIIIPIYKVERYLHKCIDCIIAQSYLNLEIILVNDGSPDNCGQICDDYARQDVRIRVIHKSNGGLSDARNAALEVMTGDYVTFIDSDDQVSSLHVELLYELLIKYNADISVTSMLSFYEQAEIVPDNSPVKECGMLKEEALKTMFYQEKFDNSACSKLYKTELFQEIRYPKGMIYEDFGTTYKLLLLSNRVAWTNRKTYYYLQRNGSIERTEFSERNFDALPLVNELLSVISEKESASYKAVVCRCVCLYWHVLLQMPSNHPKEKEMTLFIQKYRSKVLLDRHSRLKTRMACFCSFAGFNTARIIFLLLKHSII